MCFHAFLISTLDRRGRSVSKSSYFTPGETASYPLDKRLGELLSSSGYCAGETVVLRVFIY